VADAAAGLTRPLDARVLRLPEGGDTMAEDRDGKSGSTCALFNQGDCTAPMIAAIYARKSTEQSGVADEQKPVARQIEQLHAR
jgi:hypothetical protein